MSFYTIITVDMLDSDQRRLLGDFVRAHRERLPPEAPTGRRRTPGMRREELAAKAGMSPTWCAWIEQGREVQASPEALGRLARALVLSRAERVYLFELSGRRDPERAASDPMPDAPASLRAIVAALEHPAYGLDPLWNACCWNQAAEQLFVGWLDGDHQRNLLRFVFLDSNARRLIPDWEDRARRLLAEFRADYAQTFRDARVRGLAEELLASSPMFAAAWNEQGVQQRAGGVREFVHPTEGSLAFEQHTFHPAERRGYKLVVLLRSPPSG
jgi:transcriptional regulator with XRE-family HTH domain